MLSLVNTSDSQNKCPLAISNLENPTAPKPHILRAGNLHGMVAKVFHSQSLKTDELMAVWESETTTRRKKN